MMLLKVGFFWLLLCVAGTLFSLKTLISQYMEYEISTRVNFSFEKTIKLPAVTVCFPLLDTVLWEKEKVKSSCKKLMGAVSSMCNQSLDMSRMLRMKATYNDLVNATYNFISHFTVDEILEELTIGLEDIVESYNRFNASLGEQDRYQNLYDTFTIKESLQSDWRCTILTWKKEFGKQTFKNLKRQLSTPGLFLFLMNNDTLAQKLSAISVGLESNDNMEFNTERADFVMMPAKGGFSAATYEHYSSKLLEAPFATDCVNYSKLGFENRNHCYESCQTQEMKRRFRKKISGASQYADGVDMKIMSPEFAKQNRRIIRQVDEMCESNCAKQDCDQEFYTMKMKVSDTDFPSSVSGMLLFLPTSPEAATESTPKSSFAQFAADMGSAIGFWLGLSILSILEKLSDKAKIILTCMNIVRKTSSFFQRKAVERETSRRQRNVIPIRNHRIFPHYLIFGGHYIL